MTREELPLLFSTARDALLLQNNSIYQELLNLSAPFLRTRVLQLERELSSQLDANAYLTDLLMDAEEELERIRK